VRAVVVLALVAGCGGDTGPGHISGTVPIGISAALLGQGWLAGGMTRKVVLTSEAALCDEISHGVFPTDYQSLTLSLVVFDPGSGFAPATEPGAYSVISDDPEGAGSYVEASYMAVAGNRVSATQLGVAGSVAVGTLDAKGTRGSFDVNFLGGGHLSGDFQAIVCDALSCPRDVAPPPAGCFVF
jgi:hypothetical protein